MSEGYLTDIMVCQSGEKDMLINTDTIDLFNQPIRCHSVHIANGDLA